MDLVIALTFYNQASSILYMKHNNIKICSYN